MFSKARLQLSHTNLPVSSLGGGPEWPDFQRCEQEVHSVAGPSGPVLLLPHSCPLQRHHVHCHVPPSQKRRWPPSELMLGKPRPQKSHAYSPLSFWEGGLLWPERYRALHAEQSVFAPLGPLALWWVSDSRQPHHSHDQTLWPSQKRTWPKSWGRFS